ncbi:MAG: HEAT repeat domain-containing protein [Pseudomonadota bacterium]
MPQSVDALMLLSSTCPHCPGVLAALADLVKKGVLGRLEVVNLEQHPKVGETWGARSVPWLKLGPFVLTGARTPAELATWVARARDGEAREDSEPGGGMADAFHDLLKTGDLAQVQALVAACPARLAALLPIVANPEASMNVRLGAGVVLEEYAGQAPLAALIPGLGALSGHQDSRVRADACHYLGLAGGEEARTWLQARQDDPDAEVREIAREALA